MRYLIPEFTGLGDFIQKTPMIRTIKEHDNEAVILVIGDNRWFGLDAVSSSDLIDEICNVIDYLELTVPKKYTNRDLDVIYSKLTVVQKRKLLQWLVDSKWDVYLESYEGSVPRSITALLEDCRHGRIFRHVEIDAVLRRGFFNFLKNKINSKDNIVHVPILNGRHDIDTNYDLLEATCERPIERTYDTWISIDTNCDSLEKWKLKKREYICIQPGAASGAATPKTWHPKNFVELSMSLIDNLGVKIVLVGDAGDFENIICKYRWPEGVINTAGKTTIKELGTLLVNSACAVVHDSGIMHIANSMNVPLVALYGPTDYTRTRPLGKSSLILYSYTRAFAVMYRSKKSESKLAEEYPDHQAMVGITVDEVGDAVVDIYRRNTVS